MRLNRFIALAGVSSRRGAEALIREGRVVVNGQICTELATRVGATDRVRIDGHTIRAKEFVYLLLNKPAGYLTTSSDDRRRRTIYELLPPELPKLAHVGRLDLESEGILLLTNDGELALRLSHPRYKLPKEYLVTLDREFDLADLPRMARGIYLEEGRARLDSLQKLNKLQVRVVLKQGIKRQIRRMFAAAGYKVKNLYRRRIGPITDRGIKPGESRFLSEAEVKLLSQEF
jgi:23S rRNA pseudouridine2605 synthase